MDRLSQMENGQLAYRLKTMWRDGTTHIYMTPAQLLAKLAALVPAPRVNMVRFHGVLAPHAKARALVVPRPPAPEPDEVEEPEETPKRRKRYSWAELLARVFKVDMESCARCGGSLKIVAAVMDPQQVKRFLDHLGLPADPPSIASARASPQSQFEYS